ncbi:MAG: hypothetical protein K2Q17_17975 [Nitrospiraceae bacterium]|uniref:hypothetical protein n=1 Tax=Nitrospira cf. moscoviensis SBR1015 TaxID=96242 RepID=UPI000A0E690F|nr:hypothetical protein [Nitrospira cf. moscoviensis SBR1015]MBY0249543.1 hypothetical protein [Nitrospiraceae bacterium]OQW32118.1 MAG: hypothetical protein A4E20_03070 [Nitrospira sp. SG-bin2]
MGSSLNGFLELQWFYLQHNAQLGLSMKLLNSFKLTGTTAQSTMKKSLHDISAMHSWQHPLALRRLAIEAQLEMSDEAFLSRGGSREQKIQEALVGSTFLLVFRRIVWPVLGRMAKINEEALDMEAIGGNGTISSFEITAAYVPGYRIRQAYKDGNRPEIPQSAFTGNPISAEWVASSILNKTEKIRGKGMRRHLLVYNNISGGTTDFHRLPSLLGNAKDEWDSIWVIAGIPDSGYVALVANSIGLKSDLRIPPTFWGYSIDRSGVRIFGQF